MPIYQYSGFLIFRTAPFVVRGSIAERNPVDITLELGLLSDIIVTILCSVLVMTISMVMRCISFSLVLSLILLIRYTYLSKWVVSTVFN